MSAERAPRRSPWLTLLAACVAPARCVRCGRTRAALGPRVFCADCTPGDEPQLGELSGLSIAAGGAFEGSLRDAILRLKYQAAPELAGELGSWLATRLVDLKRHSDSKTNHLGDAKEVKRETRAMESAAPVSITADAPAARGSQPAPLLVPVPLHPRRLVERGYNQAALLAAALRRPLGLRTKMTGLTRERRTAVQAGLGAEARSANMRGAFRARPALRGARVILVDDVATTGSTLAACCEALHAVGAEPLGALVLAQAGS